MRAAARSCPSIVCVFLCSEYFRRATRAFVIAVSLLAATATAADTVEVALLWENKNLPGAMRVFELPENSKRPLWETRTVGSLKEAPIGKELSNGRVMIKRGRSNRFVLVYANEADSPLYFFAAPHLVEPAESALGFKFKCLCVNHAFEVPPRKVWYRVIELRLSRDFVGDRMEVTHTLVAINKGRKEKFTGNAEDE